MSSPRQSFQVCDYLQAQDLTEEYRDLLPTLPTIEKDRWTGLSLYQYQGFWCFSRVLQGILACQKHFEAQDTDIILVTNPKSGTTWLKAMAFALVNRFKYIDHDHHPLLTTNPHDLVQYLETNLYCLKELPDLSTITSPRLFATHMPVGSLPRSVKNSSCKIVYLCRNPKDMFVSMWYYFEKLFPKETRSNNLEEAFDLFCRGEHTRGPSWDHVLGYWNESLKNPRKVLFLKYEEIQKHPTTQLRRLAEFLECPFSPKEEDEGVVDEITRLCSFNHLSNLEVNKSGKLSNGGNSHMFFRKGEIGNWAKVLTSEMAEKIDLITQHKMRGSGFEF